jgi:hypothetical protein
MKRRLGLPRVLRGFAFLILIPCLCAAHETALASTATTASAEGRQWFAFEPARDDFSSTILDCSRFVEAPAGRHGFVKVEGDRFVFADGAPARFYGAQTSMWQGDELEYALRRMRRQGLNITRTHGLPSLNNRNATTSLEYSKEGFDRLDRFIAKLGENGIYIILDVQYPLTYRWRAGDSIAGLPKGGSASHIQFFNEKAAAIMHQRMADVFTHKNPYTGKRYCDDPTIALVEVLNEDSLFWGSIDERFMPELERKFAAWLKAKYGDEAGLRKAWGANGGSPLADGEGLAPDQRMRLARPWELTEDSFKKRPERTARALDQLRFYLDLEDRYWAASRDAMRKAGVKVPISGTNWQGHNGLTTRIHMLGQSRFDYIDRHGYWDHPAGEGALKWSIRTALFHNLPMVKAVKADQDQLIYLGVGNLVTDKAWEQVLGKPMTVSEWNTCVPNEHALEGPPLMTAYGLLQGWDGPLEFGYFSPDFRDRMGSGSFDMLANPPQILQFPALATMWHRQDVREADLIAESLYTPETVFDPVEDRKPLPIAAALIGKVGYRFVEKPRKPVVKDLGRFWDPKQLTARSITGELAWNAADGVVTVDTPRTKAVIGFLGSQKQHDLGQGETVIQSPTRFGAIYVTAMDGDAPIRAARRLLVTAIGPARNTGMEYERTTETSRLGPYWRLREAGRSPILLAAVTGDLSIQVQPPERAQRFKAWALDGVGKRVREVALTREAGRLHLALEPDAKAVYYEIAEE